MKRQLKKIECDVNTWERDAKDRDVCKGIVTQSVTRIEESRMEEYKGRRQSRHGSLESNIQCNKCQWRNATAGGPPSIGHFWPPFAPLRRPPPPPSPKKFRSVYHFGSQNIFPDIPQFFLNTKKFFQETPKNFQDI